MEAFLFYIKVSNSLVIAEMKISEVLNVIMLFVMLIYRENLQGLKRTINSNGLKR